MNKISQEILYLANLLQVPAPDRFSQDWEYELNIDSTRVNTFLDVYEMSNLSDYQKELLLKIIIEMINDSMENGNYGNRPITRYLSTHSLLQYTVRKTKLEDLLCHSPSSH
ncbi:hypothetical protein HPB00_03910 [Streptococcus suis]|nr:hypothetical protein [Streptococcus suis]